MDDFQVIYYKNDEELTNTIINGLKKAYKLKELGDVNWFLGVRVVRVRKDKKIYLIYNIYIEKIVKKYNLVDRKCLSTSLLIYKLKKNPGTVTKGQIKEY